MGSPVRSRGRILEQEPDNCRATVRFAEFDASVGGWINHVRYADSWGLRTHVLNRFPLEGRPIRKPSRKSSKRRAARTARVQGS